MMDGYIRGLVWLVGWFWFVTIFSWDQENKGRFSPSLNSGLSLNSLSSGLGKPPISAPFFSPWTV